MSRGFSKAFGLKNCRTLCGSKNSRYDEICALLRDDPIVEPALILLDRNLGHGVNSNGKRVPMPTGDIVSTRLRLQQGFDCCLILLTGDACEQLDQYKKLYGGYLIDIVLDKHHLPSYVHVFEEYTKWVAEKLPLRQLLLDGKISAVHVSLVNATAALQLVHSSVGVYRGVKRIAKARSTGQEEPEEKQEQAHDGEVPTVVRTCEPDGGDNNQQYEEALAPLVHALKEALPVLQLCKVKYLCDLIADVLLDPKRALNNFGCERESLILDVRKPALLSKLAREVTLTRLIFENAIELLEEKLGHRL